MLVDYFFFANFAPAFTKHLLWCFLILEKRKNIRDNEKESIFGTMCQR